MLKQKRHLALKHPISFCHFCSWKEANLSKIRINLTMYNLQNPRFFANDNEGPRKGLIENKFRFATFATRTFVIWWIASVLFIEDIMLCKNSPDMYLKIVCRSHIFWTREPRYWKGANCKYVQIEFFRISEKQTYYKFTLSVCTNECKQKVQRKLRIFYTRDRLFKSILIYIGPKVFESVKKCDTVCSKL